jgi:hypothetical protein
LGLPIGAKRVEGLGRHSQRVETPEMVRHSYFAVEHSGPGNFFQQLRPPNKQVSSITARIESFHKQLEQFRIHHEQLEKHAA